MSGTKVQSGPSSTSVSELGQPAVASPQAPTAREKTKRPQLSCNPCRTRKVKCDRVQPCTACSLHQIADQCHYDLTESERQPILQAEALREKDKEILRLRRQIELLGSQSNKSVSPYQDTSGPSGKQMDSGPKVPKKPANLRQKRLHKGHMTDSIYFGAPGMTSVIEEFANLSVEPKAASLTHSIPRGADVFAFQMATSHPFPTLWPAKDGTSALTQLLPSKDEVFSYLDAFQLRSQSCSFPHVPEECTKKEVGRFMANLDHNALVHPDMLALLFATLAQGLQNGVYDKCGGRWIAGALEEESKKGDVYIAAAMQALRTASFMNRPTLLAIETLVMIGPYLTNSGKFLDAWALFGVTIRLAQSIGLHRDPSHLNPPAPLGEVMVRKNLWWWMLHMDHQYSMTLGRPLGISSMGDCPAPEPLIADPVIQSLSNYIGQFTILSRQILSVGYLSNHQIDFFTDQLLALKNTLPDIINFDGTWLNEEKPLPPWPLEAQAAVFSGKTHNFLILLNRQRLENTRNDKDSAVDLLTEHTTDERDKVLRGRERVLESCRALLHSFEFFHSRVRVAMICWTTGQQAFNAAMILTISMLETGDTQDLDTVQQAYSTFLEMKQLGVHKLAGSAVEKLGNLMKDFESGELGKEPVMSKQGMILLEDPGLQGFLAGGFSPLNFNMAGNAIPYGLGDTSWAASAAGLEEAPVQATPSLSSQQPSGKKRQRKAATNPGPKPRVPVKKPSLKQQWSSARQRRASGLWMTVGSQAGPSVSGATPKRRSSVSNMSIEDSDVVVSSPEPENRQEGLSFSAQSQSHEPQMPKNHYNTAPPSGTFQRSPSYARLDTAFGDYHVRPQANVQSQYETQQPTLDYNQEHTFFTLGPGNPQPQQERFSTDRAFYQNSYEQQAAGAPNPAQTHKNQGPSEVEFARATQQPGYEGFLDEELSRAWGWMGYNSQGL